MRNFFSVYRGLSFFPES